MKKRKPQFTKKQLAGMLGFIMREAQRDADESWLPQTIVQYEDPDFPFRSMHFAHRWLDECKARGWTPVVTVLPQKYFT